MVTAGEFKILKEKYFVNENCTYLITDECPKRVILIVNFRSPKDKFNHNIIEMIKDAINVYGISGKRILARYTPFTSSNSKIISIGKFADEASFFIDTEGKSYFIDFYSLLCPNFYRLINNLKFLNIDYRNLVLLRNNKFQKAFTTLNVCISTSQLNEMYESIESTFGFAPKDLVIYLEYCKKHYKKYYDPKSSWDICSLSDVDYRIKFLKEVFNEPLENLMKYFNFLSHVGWKNYLTSKFQFDITKEERLKLRRRLNFLYDTHEKLKALDCIEIIEYNCKDYFRMYDTLPKKLQKKWPICPPNFNTIKRYHDELVTFFNKLQCEITNAKNTEIQQQYLDNYYKIAKTFEMSDNKYSIIACKKLSDLLYEGEYLHHCVGSYIKSVSKGQEYILFLRKKEDIKTPYFTIDIVGNVVRQIHGFANCNMNAEIKPFIKEWARRFNLDISNCSELKRALR